MQKYITADSSSYPLVEVMGENKQLAARLVGTFAGKNGEYSAVSDYVYQGLVFKENYPEYAEVFKSLAMVEMRHMQMIGELIVLLGGEVFYGEYQSNAKIYWSGSWTDYSKDLAAVLLYDLGNEQKSYSDYVYIARKATDRHVFALLTRIALDEMLHINLLKMLIAKLRRVGEK